MDLLKVKGMSKKMRRKILDITFSCNSSVHIGGRCQWLKLWQHYTVVFLGMT